MSTRRLTNILLSVLFLVPLASEPAQSRAPCRTQAPGSIEPGAYPDHSLSPMESLQHYDVVFLGEVVVPSRACSLGYCAGIKVLQTIKGKASLGNLIQITKPRETSCNPAYFGDKGQRWVIFANRGTSKTGLPYLYAEDLGPSFPSPEVPNFAMLEGRYRALRASLDHALEERFGRTHVR